MKPSEIAVVLEPSPTIWPPRQRAAIDAFTDDRGHLLDDVLSVAREVLVEMETPRTTGGPHSPGIWTMSSRYTPRGNFRVS
jgi:hypothetical protein